MIKFYFNGIKEDGGKLQRCFFSDGQLINFPAGTLTIYKRDYDHFSAGVHAAFKVENDSDYQSDYCVQDLIRVAPEHPLYHDVMDALLMAKAHNAKTSAKRQARYTQAQRAAA